MILFSAKENENIYSLFIYLSISRKKDIFRRDCGQSKTFIRWWLGYANIYYDGRWCDIIIKEEFHA